MKNQWNGSGFITKELEPKSFKTKNGEDMSMLRFSIGIKRKSKDSGSDFVPCIAFGKNADSICKYFGKGKGIEITGHIQTGSYNKPDGHTVYTTDVIVDEWDFPAVRKNEDSNPAPEQPHEQEIPNSAPESNFMKIPENIADSLPFK